MNTNFTLKNLATFSFWRNWWFYWLLAVLLSWIPAELFSLYLGHYFGAPVIEQWTLSDTIRHWVELNRWLAPVAVGVMCMLIFHFFVQKNPEPPHARLMRMVRNGKN